jgi:hypothetical protein
VERCQGAGCTTFVEVNTLEGNLSSQARVAYCQRLAGESFRVGLELFVPTGR